MTPLQEWWKPTQVLFTSSVIIQFTPRKSAVSVTWMFLPTYWLSNIPSQSQLNKNTQTVLLLNNRWLTGIFNCAQKCQNHLSIFPALSISPRHICSSSRHTFIKVGHRYRVLLLFKWEHMSICSCGLINIGSSNYCRIMVYVQWLNCSAYFHHCEGKCQQFLDNDGDSSHRAKKKTIQALITQTIIVSWLNSLLMLAYLRDLLTMTKTRNIKEIIL